MREISLHIMDIFYNSLQADASLIKVSIDVDTKKDMMEIKIIDNGKGMKKEFVNNVLDPFTTTRSTRNVGLGLSLFKASANRCEGDLTIWSKEKIGTIVKAWYKYSHIDRQPLGNMKDTVYIMILTLGNNNLIYSVKKDDKSFILDTRKIREEIGDDSPLTSPGTMGEIKMLLEEEEKNINIS